MADDVNEGIENALNVIVSTTRSSGNKKKELKTTIFDTVSNLRKLFAKLIDTNENNARKIAELEKQVANTKKKREVGRSRAQNYIGELSSAPERKTHGQTVSKVAQLSGGRDKLYSEVVVGKAIQNVYKVAVISRDNQTAETIKEMMQSQINPAEIKVGIESIKTLRENYANVEMSKINEWSRRNKIKIHDKKSKAMLVTRRKRREDKDITIYLHFNPLEQVTQMKYLGIILEQKFKFQEHIRYAAEMCTKLIHNLSRSARMTWELKNEAVATIYKGAILPLLMYGAPIWSEAMKCEHNRQKYVRVQRLINLKMARAYRTTSNEALCILTGTTPNILKLEEVVKQYTFRDKQQQQTINLDYEVEYRLWPHPAKSISIIET